MSTRSSIKVVTLDENDKQECECLFYKHRDGGLEHTLKPIVNSILEQNTCGNREVMEMLFKTFSGEDELQLQPMKYRGKMDEEYMYTIYAGFQTHKSAPASLKIVCEGKGEIVFGREKGKRIIEKNTTEALFEILNKESSQNL